MPGLIATAASIISILILFLIFVKDVGGTQDNNTITLTVLFNEIVASPNAGRLLIDNALEALTN
jgi:hypothetical protein